jgi:hypothetical protein
METNNIQNQKYKRAQRRVKKIKGFYSHLIVYIVINLLLSSFNIYRFMEDGYEFNEVITQFGVFSTPVFWGIGLFFHWMGVFGFKSVFSSDWEERKIKEYMNER